MPCDTLRITNELPNVGAILEAWRLQMFHNVKNDKLLFMNI